MLITRYLPPEKGRRDFVCGHCTYFHREFMWDGRISFGSVFWLLAPAFFIHLLATTKYTLSDGTLHVSYGFFHGKHIAVSSIRKITGKKSFAGLRALSQDSLEVFYNRFDSVQLSPKDQNSFIRRLLEINPHIVIENPA